MMDIKHCEGCKNNFFNHYGIGRCHYLPDAKLVIRVKTPLFNSPVAYGPEELPNCYTDPGFTIKTTEIS